MILYHGSNMTFDSIDLSKSKRFKDFGRAFYLSDNNEQARLMAEAKVELFGGTPVVTLYNFEDAQLNNKSLKIKTFNEYSKQWAEFVFNNRDENQLYEHEFDIVYGPIANDYVGLQIRELKRGNISFATFVRQLKYHKGITFQYAFCTQKAIDLLTKL